MTTGNTASSTKGNGTAHEQPKRTLPHKKQRKSGPAFTSLRAANEDDDGYDPYSDYMDELARSGYEEPSEDPWR